MTRTVTALVAVALLALAPIGFAQEASELDVSEAEGFIGMWTLSLESGPRTVRLQPGRQGYGWQGRSHVQQ